MEFSAKGPVSPKTQSDSAHARIPRMALDRAFKFAANLLSVRERIEKAAQRASRLADQITIVAVSKRVPADMIRIAFFGGLRHFGENRVQEWEEKQPEVVDLGAQWHLIGHLQSNKARRAAHLFHRVDSVDDVPLAQKLDASAAAEGRRLGALIEVRLGDEPSKSGIAEASLAMLAEAVEALPNLELLGLMTVPPFFENPEAVRPCFRNLRKLRDRTSERLGRTLPVLSMGMSHDFEVAIEEGATEIRLGTALFGERNPNT